MLRGTRDVLLKQNAVSLVNVRQRTPSLNGAQIFDCAVSDAPQLDAFSLGIESNDSDVPAKKCRTTILESK
jgi:hypothetical protein